MRNSIIFSILVAVLLVSGCSRKVPEIDGGPVVDSGYSNSIPASTPSDSNIDQMGGMDQSSGFASDDQRVVALENEIQTVYFATDSYQLSPSEIDKITQNANILNGDLSSDLSIKIEGNCDEWGTDEYNYALGLKRAKSVKNSLNQMGVAENRMALISYGESKPKCTEHNAGCWQQNRRVDLKLFP
jgi:peptidoglycan-associated lipoprotein